MDSAHLNIIYPDGRRSEIAVTKGSFVIGRDADSDLSLDDRAVSRQHARLVQSNTGWKIIDLGSANGTYVEGERLFTLDARRLQNNTTIRIGGSTLTFQLIPEELADIFRPAVTPEVPVDHAALLKEMSSWLVLPDVPAPTDDQPSAPAETPQPSTSSAAAPTQVEAETSPPSIESVVPPPPLNVEERESTPTPAAPAQDGIEPLPLSLLPVAPPTAELEDGLAALLPRNTRVYNHSGTTTNDAANEGAAALAELAPPTSTPSSDAWQIVVNYSAQDTGVYDITTNPFAIGRAENNNLRLDDPSIAPHHVRLTYRGDSWRILDLGSATGTRINNERIPPQTARVLNNGALLQVGNLQLTLRQRVWRLRVTHRSGRQQVIELNSSPFGIGSANDNKLELTESGIANYHAELIRETNGWCILDLGSDEGTYVDGVRLLSQYPQSLNDGSSIQIGETTLLISIGTSVPQPTVERPRLTIDVPSTKEGEPVLVEPAPVVAPPVEPPVVVEAEVLEEATVPRSPTPNTARPGWFRRWFGRPAEVPQTATSVEPVQPVRSPQVNNEPAVAPVVVPPVETQTSVAVPTTSRVVRPIPAAPKPSTGPSAYKKINNIGIVRYWRLRAMRAIVVLVGETVGIYRMQSFFSRTFGFIPRWLVSAGDVDTWNSNLDRAVGKASPKPTPATTYPSNPPDDSLPVAETSSAPRVVAPSAQNGSVNHAPQIIPVPIAPADGQMLPNNAQALQAASALLQTELENLSTNAQTQVLISPEDLTVDPGAAVAALITVFNRSSVVDRITITIIGIPEAWATVTPRSFPLFPGTRAEAQLLLRPPRGPSSLAGEHHFAVIGLSEQSPQDRVFARAVLTITPYAEFRLELRPQQQAGWRKAAYRLEVVNNGNRAQAYHLEGRDEEDLMDFLFAPAQPVINPGETAHVRVQTLLRRRHWFGPAKTSVFFANSTPVNDVIPGQQVVGRFIQQPIFTLVTLLAIVLLLLACLGPVAYKAWTAFFAPLPTPTAQPTTQPLTAVPSPTIAPTQVPPTPIALPTPNQIIVVPPTITPTLAATIEITPTTVIVTPTILPTVSPLPTLTPTPPGDLQLAPGATFTITTTFTPNTAYLVYFDDRVITGGSVRADGQIVVVLTLGKETPGLHTLVVRERGTSRLIFQKTVNVPEP